MIIYRTKFVLPNGKIFYYVGKDIKNNKKYLGSGKLLPWFIRNSIYTQKITIESVNSKNELIERENFWLKKLKCSISENYLNIQGYSSGGAIIINKDKWKTSLRMASPKRINSYKKTRACFSANKKLEISRNISNAVKYAISQQSNEEKKARKYRELLTKSKHTKEQRDHESYLKSQAAKSTSLNRTPEERITYCQKVSDGVRRYKASLSTEDKKNIIKLYRTTMYKKNGMYEYISTVCNMIPYKSSLEIFHFLKSQNIKTHHICVKRFIDFLKKYFIINI